MGHIIGLSFNNSGENQDWLDTLIRGAPHFAEYVEQSRAYIFRDSDVPVGDDPTPDCEAWMKSDGLVFNWLGGGRVPKVVYEFLMESLRTKLGQVKEDF